MGRQIVVRRDASCRGRIECHEIVMDRKKHASPGPRPLRESMPAQRKNHKNSAGGRTGKEYQSTSPLRAGVAVDRVRFQEHASISGSFLVSEGRINEWDILLSVRETVG
jgi:hypothetical protein